LTATPHVIVRVSGLVGRVSGQIQLAENTWFKVDTKACAACYLESITFAPLRISLFASKARAGSYPGICQFGVSRLFSGFPWLP